MSETVTMYDLAPSPNSMKVRLALGFKGIPFEKAAVDPSDRAEIVKLSGQPLTPVLKHGETVVFDSAAILRYLEANFKGTPQIFSTNYDEMREIERWENLGRTECIKPIGMMFGQFFSPEKSPEQIEAACKMLNDATAQVEERLAASEWLVADRLTAADITVAAAVSYGMLPPEAAGQNPIVGFFQSNLKLGEGRDRTRAWVARVIGYDR